MGCILCCFPKKYNEINTNINTETNISTNKKFNKNYNRNYNRNYSRNYSRNYNRNYDRNYDRPNSAPFLLTNIQLQSFDDILLKNNKSERKKADIYRKWRENYLDNSGKLYI